MIGDAIGLYGWKLVIAVGLNVLWGALMDVGFGLYAPCMATCLMLGVNGSTCFPVFMSSCTFLMPFRAQFTYNYTTCLAVLFVSFFTILLLFYSYQSVFLRIFKAFFWEKSIANFGYM